MHRALALGQAAHALKSRSHVVQVVKESVKRIVTVLQQSCLYSRLFCAILVWRGVDHRGDASVCSSTSMGIKCQQSKGPGKGHQIFADEAWDSRLQKDGTYAVDVMITLTAIAKQRRGLEHARAHPRFASRYRVQLHGLHRRTMRRSGWRDLHLSCSGV